MCLSSVTSAMTHPHRHGLLHQQLAEDRKMPRTRQPCMHACMHGCMGVGLLSEFALDLCESWL